MNSIKSKPGDEAEENLDWVEKVRELVGSIRFGAVEIVVHDSRVVQVERTERLRFNEVAKTAQSRSPAVPRLGDNQSAPR